MRWSFAGLGAGYVWCGVAKKDLVRDLCLICMQIAYHRASSTYSRNRRSSRRRRRWCVCFHLRIPHRLLYLPIIYAVSSPLARWNVIFYSCFSSEDTKYYEAPRAFSSSTSIYLYICGWCASVCWFALDAHGLVVVLDMDLLQAPQKLLRNHASTLCSIQYSANRYIIIDKHFAWWMGFKMVFIWIIYTFKFGTHLR